MGYYLVHILSSTVVTRSNVVQYCIKDYRNWGRIAIKCGIHKRHPISHPRGQAMGCLLWIFQVQDNWPHYNSTPLYIYVISLSECDIVCKVTLASAGYGSDYINGLMQERCNSIANPLELRLSCTNPSIWTPQTIPHLTLTSELWNVFCEYFVEKWQCYKDVSIYWVYYTA